MSQFLFQTPAGYLYDYTTSKILWLSVAAIATTALTVFTAIFAAPEGGNLALMIFIKFLQGAVTSFIPPGLNSITQGIVGASGMTSQVARIRFITVRRFQGWFDQNTRTQQMLSAFATTTSGVGSWRASSGGL